MDASRGASKNEIVARDMTTVSARPHVAIVDEWLPYPVDNGKKLRSYHLLVPLAEDYRISYLAPRGQDRNADMVAEGILRDHGFEICWIDRPVPRNSGPWFASRLAANLLSTLPYSVQRHQSSGFSRALRERFGENSLDLVHVEWTPYLANVPKDLCAPITINAHNIESIIWQRYTELEKNRLKYWYLRQQWKKFQAFERRAFRRADCVIATTEIDAALARQEYQAQHVEVVSNGVDLDRFKMVAAGRNRHDLLFLGSLAWRPNLMAVQDLLDRIFPRIHAEMPSIQLTIVGLDPPAWLKQRVTQLPNVTLHANVPDVVPYLSRCAAMVVPLSVGGGSRIKILEALASGCPVIATPVGAEGLHLRPQVDFVLAPKLESFADVTIAALRDEQSLCRTAAMGSAVVRQNYGWKDLSKKLGAIWAAQLASEAIAAG
jgi:polysaccharide biosynthesis protein PslH